MLTYIILIIFPIAFNIIARMWIVQNSSIVIYSILMVDIAYALFVSIYIHEKHVNKILGTKFPCSLIALLLVIVELFMYALVLKNGIIEIKTKYTIDIVLFAIVIVLIRLFYKINKKISNNM